MLKIGSVKSASSVMQGMKPMWDQEFCFEITDYEEFGHFNNGLIIELWNSETSWDKLLGINWISFNNLINNEKTKQFWLSLDSELCIRNGTEIIGTKNPTDNYILVELRVENLQLENISINFDDDLANNISSIINNGFNEDVNSISQDEVRIIINNK